MKPTEEIKKNVNELESKLKSMILEFIDKNGVCDISIDTNLTFIHVAGCNPKISRCNPKISITI